MLLIIAAILVILWLFGMITAFTMGGVIHVLLVLAAISILVQVISGNRR